MRAAGRRGLGPRRPRRGDKRMSTLIELVRTLYRYNEWANARIVAATGRLSPEQLSAPGDAGHGSVHETLVHIMAAQWIWLARWNGTSPTSMPSAAEFPARGMTWSAPT